MQLEPVLAALRATIQNQASLTGDDPQVDTAVGAVVAALEPALRQAATDLAQQAAAEIDAQLPEHAVSVVLRGGDVELRVDDAKTGAPAAPTEDLDARITLRLPPSLKEAVERVASLDGGSVNSWVVDTLWRQASRTKPPGDRITEEFDL